MSLKNKLLASENEKNSADRSDARARTESQRNATTKRSALAASEAKLKKAQRTESAVGRVIRGAARLADMITDKDREAALEVIRGAMKATHTMWDRDAKQLTTFPDHKTRLAAATLQLAYDEGTPIQRQVSVQASFATSEEIMRRIQGDPRARQALESLAALGYGVPPENRDQEEA